MSLPFSHGRRSFSARKPFSDASLGSNAFHLHSNEFEASMTAIHGSGQRLPQKARGRTEFLVRRLLGAESEIEILIDLKDWLDDIHP